MYIQLLFLNLAVGASGWVLVGIPEYSHLFPPTYLLPPTLQEKFFSQQLPPTPNGKNSLLMGVYTLKH